MKIILPICILLCSCARSDTELVERTVVTGEMSGAPVALQIDRQQSAKSQHSISLPPALLNAATGGWGGIVGAIAGALGLGGAAAALRGTAGKSALTAVVRGVEKLRNKPGLTDEQRQEIDNMLREEMSERDKRQIRKVKGKA